MNKFGLLDEEEAASRATPLSDKIAMFGPVRARQAVDLAAVDAAAAQHGFTSREAAEPAAGVPPGRRRRAIRAEPTRHLAIRVTEGVYDRFVAYADRYELTYHDALVRLMDGVNE